MWSQLVLWKKRLQRNAKTVREIFSCISAYSSKFRIQKWVLLIVFRHLKTSKLNGLKNRVCCNRTLWLQCFFVLRQIFIQGEKTTSFRKEADKFWWKQENCCLSLTNVWKGFLMVFFKQNDFFQQEIFFRYGIVLCILLCKISN